MKRALVVGYGSIGMRHARILEELGLDVSVVSRRRVEHPRAYGALGQALAEWRPDYVVVASRTHEHLGDISALAASGYDGIVLVEKPLFARAFEIPPHRFKHAYVAYNLRFHPVLQALRDHLAETRPFALYIACGSHLPSWRPQVDYRRGYSASTDQGGGVLRDLSHEIDYVLWMTGGWENVAATGGHLSQLEIDSDDVFALLMTTAKVRLVTITLDYVDTRPRREIRAMTPAGTFCADLLAGTLSLGPETLMRSAVERDDTYRAQHRAVLSGDSEHLCTLPQGLDVVALIDAAERAATTRTWTTRPH